MKSKPMKDLQLGFSSMHARDMYDEEKRQRKGKKVLSILEAHLGTLKDKKHLDIGASTGFMTKLYSEHFADSTGIDVDAPAIEFANKQFASDKLRFKVANAMETGLPSKSFDVITCTHIYEHVPDSAVLMAEIHRLLKDDGVCFFAAGNRFTLVEEHYKLPLLSAIPKALAHPYIRLAGKADHYYETHLSLYGLKKLTRNFKVTDYTYQVLADPVKFHASDVVRPGSLKQKIALKTKPLTRWLIPTYLWILTPIRD